MGDRFAAARRIADAVLYEGYVLYPYRASATKNRLRWQFGVLAPEGWVAAGGCEHASLSCELLLAPGAAGGTLRGRLRFLQLALRTGDGAPWDEGIERAVDFDVDLGARGARGVPFALPGGEARDGETRRVTRALDGMLGHAVEEVEAADGGALLRVRVWVENRTACNAGVPRDEALRASLVGAHLLFAAEGARFLSLLDPPPPARAAAAACRQERCWPVLVGDGDLVLASPIILYDQPRIAPESAGDLHDGTEIDEILTLRTMTLTEDEKREARATDARAAAIIDRVDAMTAEELERLHGARRDLAWFDPVADAAVSPDREVVEVAGVTVAKGCHVRLRPGARRSDAQDMFLVGLAATVQGVYLDVEGRRYVAVTLDDDPAADLNVDHGRFRYFYPDELEPLGGAS